MLNIIKCTIEVVIPPKMFVSLQFPAVLFSKAFAKLEIPIKAFCRPRVLNYSPKHYYSPNLSLKSNCCPTLALSNFTESPSAQFR